MADKLLKGTTSKPKETTAQALERIARLGMSPRQQMLNTLWAWYRCEHYSARRLDWDGKENLDPIAHEAVATAGILPPGFYDAGATMPIKFRKPTAPYALAKIIVDRFTGLLFSEQRHPHMRVEGDADGEDYIEALLEAARLWPAMIQARTYGGSMGSVAIGFQFVDGRPNVEVHDPRWTIPDFVDRFALKLRSVEKRYMYPVDTRDPETGAYVPVWHWYRRIIDETSDVLYKPALVGDGDEPEWVEDKRVDHNLGFCPVVWVQNLPVQDEIDGDPDPVGTYETIEAIDALYAQANRGTIANCDPTVVVVTNASLGEIKKGSDNAIKLPEGSASYMEMQGTGPDAALKLADKLRGHVLEVAQCVVDHPDQTQRTATEIERKYEAMIAKAGILREQYGEKGIKPLVEMMLKAVTQLGKGRTNSEGVTVKGSVVLPPRVSVSDAGEIERTERKPPEEIHNVTIQWRRYFEPLLVDTELAARSAVAAKAGHLIDQEHAVKFVAEYFKVEDVQAMMVRIQQEKDEAEQKLAEQALGMLNGPGLGGEGGEGGEPGDDDDDDDDEPGGNGVKKSSPAPKPKPRRPGATAQ